MSHALSRAESAPGESCARAPGENCEVCRSRPADAAFGDCCTRNCEEAAYRRTALDAIVADPAASLVAKLYAIDELRLLAVQVREAA